MAGPGGGMESRPFELLPSRTSDSSESEAGGGAKLGEGRGGTEVLFTNIIYSKSQK